MDRKNKGIQCKSWVILWNRNVMMPATKRKCFFVCILFRPAIDMMNRNRCTGKRLYQTFISTTNTAQCGHRIMQSNLFTCARSPSHPFCFYGFNRLGRYRFKSTSFGFFISPLGSKLLFFKLLRFVFRGFCLLNLS